MVFLKLGFILQPLFFITRWWVQIIWILHCSMQMSLKSLRSSSQVQNSKLGIADLIGDVSGRLHRKVLVLFCTASSRAPHFLCYSSKAACEMNAAVTAHCPGKARRIRLPLLAVSASICIHQLERLAYQQWNKTKESTLRIWGIKIHWTSEMNFNRRVKFADVLVWGGLF